MKTSEKSPLPTRSPSPARRTDWKALAGLPDGPLDLIGDIHGEIDALSDLFGHLGYQPNGTHPRGRTMVFLGDLIDRGPDSPGVVRWIADLMDSGRAVSVMGNHDFNAIVRKPKVENAWLFGHGPSSPAERSPASDQEREDILAFLATQPLARERHDLRVVHACWDDDALQTLADATGVADAYRGHRGRISKNFTAGHDPVEVSLAHQNENPIKLITSGPETRATEPFFACGQTRHEARHPWWDGYAGETPVVFGHYWRIPLPTLQKDDRLFSTKPLNTMLGTGNTICIDYSVGGRASERRAGRVNGPYTGRLAAMRWPERELVFDNGERMPVVMPTAACGATR